MRPPLVAAAAILAAACMTPSARTTSSSAVYTAASRQTPPLGPREREVIDVVVRLFDAMRAQDSAAARALFEPGTRLRSVSRRPGGAVTVSEDSLGMFLRAIGTPRPQTLDERIANERVLIDDSYAVAWVDYTFYLGEQKSHCGIDAFQLVRRPEGWRIFGLTDTRRRESCPDLPKK